MISDDDSGSTATGSFTAAGLPESYWSRYEINLPRDYCQVIGEICSRWSWLEFQCGVIAREIVRLDKPAGYALTATYGTNMRMESGDTVPLATPVSAYGSSDAPEDRMEPNWVHKPIAALRADAATLEALQHKAEDLTWDLKDALRRTRVPRRPRS